MLDKAPTEPEQPMFFFMIAAQVSFIKDNAPRQRYMNIMLELGDPAITKQVLNHAHHTALSRMHNESEVPAEDVKDVVFLNISLLGHMTPTEFHHVG